MSEATVHKTWDPADNTRGVVCRKCGCADLRVLNTRYSMGRIVRYRQCRNCGKRVTTYEVPPAMLDSASQELAPRWG
jgi:hypothetical protein